MLAGDFNDTSVVADRRWAFLTVVVFIWVLAGMLMAARISATGWTLGTLGLYVLFLLLQLQVIYGFTLGITGAWVLWRGGDPLRINLTLPPETSFVPLPTTAVIMPIFNEDVGRVFQGLKVMYESLRATGQGPAFDLFVLSDSSDLNVWLEEEKAWFALCKQVNGFGHIFYRKRRMTVHHKSGNVADFCRRWGSKYRYVVVLDADSVMSGKTIVRLVTLMENRPQAGIIQSYSRPVLGRSLFQRLSQFAAHAYGPLFVAGANFWQLGNASFFGHNAIIRLKPFMQFCAMPELPPAGRLGTRILSHDTVEAALIRKAGYEVWSDCDLDGSYEEGPPHLIASLKRDRRWCHGNLQHIWFLFSRGLTMPSRINILVGIMAYASSPLWLLFLLFSPVLFVGNQAQSNSAFLFCMAMFLLFVPKILGAWHLVSNSHHSKSAGTPFKILVSTMVESLLSMLLAPILMLFYTQFVWSSIFGASVGWGRQERSDEDGPSWQDCIKAHRTQTGLAVAAGALVAWRMPGMFPWLCLVLLGPVLSIPFSRLTASGKLGLWARRHGLFIVPEETQAIPLLQPLQEPFKTGNGLRRSAELGEDFGLAQTALDPRTNAIHVTLLRERSHASRHNEDRLNSLCDQLLAQGPAALPPRDKKIVLWDPDAMQLLHQKLWDSPASQIHEWWRAAFESYRASLSSFGTTAP